MHGEKDSLHIRIEVKIVELLVNSAERRQLRDPGIRENYIDLPVLLPDLVVQTVEIGQAGDIALNRGYVFANLRHRPVQRVFTPAGDEHMIHRFLDESFRRG